MVSFGEMDCGAGEYSRSLYYTVHRDGALRDEALRDGALSSEDGA